MELSNGFQRVSARRNYEFELNEDELEYVSSVSLHVGIMNFCTWVQVLRWVSSVSLHVGIMN